MNKKLHMHAKPAEELGARYVTPKIEGAAQNQLFQNSSATTVHEHVLLAVQHVTAVPHTAQVVTEYNHLCVCVPAVHVDLLGDTGTGLLHDSITTLACG